MILVGPPILCALILSAQSPPATVPPPTTIPTQVILTPTPVPPDTVHDVPPSPTVIPTQVPANPTPQTSTSEWLFLLAVGLAILAGYFWGKSRRARR